MAITNVREFLDKLYGVATSSRSSADPSTIGVTAGRILKQDSRRLAATVVNLSPNTIYLAPIGVPSATNGIRLEANGGTANISAAEDGEAVAWEWLGVATGALSNYFVLETLIETQG